MPPLLNGLTILRYGHVYDTGGGMERYLADLNRELLTRNTFQTIQVELTSDPGLVGESEEDHATSRLRRVSLFVGQASHERAVNGAYSPTDRRPRLRSPLRERALRAPGISWLARTALAGRRIPRRDGEPLGAGETIRFLHHRFPIDLICLHTAGTADVGEILAVAAIDRIPVVYVHHFSNDRLAGPSMRRQLERMNGVAGVTGVGIPSFLHSTFRVVSDGIDVEYWRRSAARALGRTFAGPVVLLPARITPAKGQDDLIKIAGALHRRGLRFQIVFAGRVDTPGFMPALEQMIRDEGLQGRVDFVGPLDAPDLRDWYAAASVMAFPTYHAEGLPRVVLEAQAMMVPPIVYDVGGTSDGIDHSVTGFLVQPANRAQFEERLAELIQSASRRDGMGGAGRRLVEERFTLAALADRHEAFYREIVDASRSYTASMTTPHRRRG